jgi:hypothetical protein
MDDVEPTLTEKRAEQLEASWKQFKIEFEEAKLMNPRIDRELPQFLADSAEIVERIFNFFSIDKVDPKDT